MSHANRESRLAATFPQLGGDRTRCVSLDLVIPFYNEADVLPLLLDTPAATVDQVAAQRYGLASVRCIFVDDGSTDDSVATLCRAAAPSLHFSIVRLSRNFGHQAAVTAGLEHSTADLIAVINGNPPERRVQ